MVTTIPKAEEITENASNKPIAPVDPKEQNEGHEKIGDEKDLEIPIDRLLTPDMLEKLRTVDDESLKFIYPSIKSMLDKWMVKFTFLDIKSDFDTIETIIKETIVAFMLRLKNDENLTFDRKEKKASTYLIKVFQEKLLELPIDELLTTERLEKLRTMDDESWEFLYLLIKRMLERWTANSIFYDIKNDHDTIAYFIQETIDSFRDQLRKGKKFTFDGKDKKISAYLIRILKNKLFDYCKKFSNKITYIKAMKPTMADKAETINPEDSIPSLRCSADVEVAQLIDSVFFLMCFQQALQRTRKALKKVSANRFMDGKIKGKKPEEMAKEEGVNRHAIDSSNSKFGKRVFTEFKDIVQENGEELSIKELRKKFHVSLCYLMDHAELHEATLTADGKNKGKRGRNQTDRPIIARMNFLQQHLSPSLDLHYSGDCIYLFQHSKDNWNYVKGCSLRNNEVRIGRLDASKISLPDNNELSIDRLEDSTIELPMKNVSGCHAMLIRKNGAWAVEDKDSKNGTCVNDRQLAANSPQGLRTGDIIQIADFLLIFIASQSALNVLPAMNS